MLKLKKCMFKIIEDIFKHLRFCVCRNYFYQGFTKQLCTLEGHTSDKGLAL